MAAGFDNAVPPRFLVLLASRNGAAQIARQMDSVLAQDGVLVHVQVRDDGSGDGTREIVASLASRDPRVCLLEDHRPSGSAAANFFALVGQADVSTFDFVAFCDQDDEWLPHKLDRAAQQLRASDAQGYSTAVCAQWPDGRMRVQSQSNAFRIGDYLFEGAGQGCTFVFAAVLFGRLQRELAAHRALLPAIHYHDWALHALARSAGTRWIFDPRPSMIYHQHHSNDTGARSSGTGIVRRLRLIRQGWYRAQVAAIAALVARVRPEDTTAAEWIRLDAVSPVPLRLRWAKARFIARHGRRKRSDRLIQLVAVALGYL